MRDAVKRLCNNALLKEQLHQPVERPTSADVLEAFKLVYAALADDRLGLQLGVPGHLSLLQKLCEAQQADTETLREADAGPTGYVAALAQAPAAAAAAPVFSIDAAQLRAPGAAYIGELVYQYRLARAKHAKADNPFAAFGGAALRMCTANRQAVGWSEQVSK